MRLKAFVLFSFVFLFICSCRKMQERLAGIESVNASSIRVSHENLDGILWMQTSAEYEALCRMIYKAAAEALERGLADPNWTAALEQASDFASLPPAVVLDIDETVLDNTPYEAMMALEGRGRDPKAWDDWVAKTDAMPIPGAAEFLAALKKKSVVIFYITNREASEEKETIANLIQLGLPVDPSGDTVLSKNEQPGWDSDKSSRRVLVATTHRIILLIGDNLGDFVSNVRVPLEKRRDIMLKHINMWGSQWFVLPNPLYGSWEKAIYGFDLSLPDKEILKKKFEALKSYE